MERTRYTTRYIIRTVIEAETPLAVGSGKKDMLTDALVATDVNGLPFIPGTSLAGALRSACSISREDHSPFGYLDRSGGEGSRLLVSDAVMIGEEGKPMDGLRVIDYDDPFYARFKALPIRQHVRINPRGTAGNGGKFDEQIVYKGTRLCFEMELLSDGNDTDRSFFDHLVGELNKETFRIGGGTRHGFGKTRVVSTFSRVYDLTRAEDLDRYVTRSAQLTAGEGEVPMQAADEEWQRYELDLRPADFFLFGSGMGDEDVDMTPVREAYIEWESGRPRFVDSAVLIPASSVKGALAHRTAYYWNKLQHRYADSAEEEPQGLTGDDNQAVSEIFGKAGQGKSGDIRRGNIMLSDILIPVRDGKADKIFNHVSLDRFTGGSRDSALFDEKVSYLPDTHFKLTIDVRKSSIRDEEVRKSFELAMDDIGKGLLPLGGGVNRGHGVFMLNNNEK